MVDYIHSYVVSTITYLLQLEILIKVGAAFLLFLVGWTFWGDSEVRERLNNWVKQQKTKW